MVDEKTVKTPVWKCKNLQDKKKQNHVGDKFKLSCSGFSEVAPQKGYVLSFDEGQEHSLKILGVQKDQKNLKEFEVTSYRAGSGQIKVSFKNAKEEDLFDSIVDLKVDSLIKSKADSQPSPPDGFSLILPSYFQIGVFFLCFGFVCFYFFQKALKARKKRREFLKVINKANYEDPFMDFNLEIRDLKKNKKLTESFKSKLELSFKKVFFRVFQDNVFFEDIKEVNSKLKIMGVPQHEIRSVLILKKDYEKFLTVETLGDFLAVKNDFLDQAKVSINKIKRYYKGGA